MAVEIGTRTVPCVKFSRGKLLLLVSVLSVAGLGFYWTASRPAAPAGWKTERWQAGFGSWGQGGFGVAYDIQMPNAYDFQQKCGTAWISDDVDGPDFAIRLSFRPAPKDRQHDFDDFLTHDSTRYYDVSPSSIKIDEKSPYSFAAEQMSRQNFALENVRFLEPPDESSAQHGTVRGFWLDGRNLSIISDMRDPKRLAINERIVASARRVSGYGMLDLVSDSIPGLLGC